MTYPENLGSQPGAAFDLASTAEPEKTPWECPACGNVGGRCRMCDLVFSGDPTVIDPDCAAGKHGSCVGGPCSCDCHAVKYVLGRLGILADKYGPTQAAVMMITGFSAEKLTELGGVGT